MTSKERIDFTEVTFKEKEVLVIPCIQIPLIRERRTIHTGAQLKPIEQIIHAYPEAFILLKQKFLFNTIEEENNGLRIFCRSLEAYIKTVLKDEHIHAEIALAFYSQAQFFAYAEEKVRRFKATLALFFPYVRFMLYGEEATWEEVSIEKEEDIAFVETLVKKWGSLAGESSDVHTDKPLVAYLFQGSKEEAPSLAVQLEAIKAYAREQGHTLYSKVYQDAEDHTSTVRPGLQQAIRLVQLQAVRGIIVSHPSRLEIGKKEIEKGKELSVFQGFQDYLRLFNRVAVVIAVEGGDNG